MLTCKSENGEEQLDKGMSEVKFYQVSAAAGGCDHITISRLPPKDHSFQPRSWQVPWREEFLYPKTRGSSLWISLTPTGQGHQTSRNPGAALFSPLGDPWPWYRAFRSGRNQKALPGHGYIPIGRRAMHTHACVPVLIGQTLLLSCIT